ncbi:hypothetical protein IFM89_039778 [Coptis chinensis]|uniref:Uncharacterized protein n=1 Tax=Coptis chinensis TaxID=261450 RepID=A0A835GTZ1_9MAGN|nr:hypothetical protein IFM89_039778 [Coptis chinensis]
MLANPIRPGEICSFVNSSILHLLQPNMISKLRNRDPGNLSNIVSVATPSQGMRMHATKGTYITVGRFEIVNGIMDVDTINNETLKEIPQYCPEDEAVKGIPDFWLNVLRSKNSEGRNGPSHHGALLSHHSFLRVTEADEKVLAFLQDIRICHLSNPNRIRLEFLFECNPYFKNTVLTKTYHVQTDGKKSYMRKAIGTEIEWYFGQSPKKLLVRNKPKKGSQKTKPVIEFESCESFFYYFTTSEDAKYVLKDEPKNDKRDDKECCGGDHDDDHRNADDDADKSKLEVVIVMTRTKEMKLIVKMMMMSTMMSWEDDCKIGNKILYEILPEAVKWCEGERRDFDYWDSDEDCSFNEEAEMKSLKDIVKPDDGFDVAGSNIRARNIDGGAKNFIGGSSISSVGKG